jgi:hypothetical protein
MAAGREGTTSPGELADSHKAGAQFPSPVVGEGREGGAGHRAPGRSRPAVHQSQGRGRRDSQARPLRLTLRSLVRSSRERFALLRSRRCERADHPPYRRHRHPQARMVYPMRFRKAGGFTPSEKLLADVCERSFLSLWSYPNLFRKPGKELCDLLVVFGDEVVIFSDKSCAYPETGDAALDWNRWYRRSIADSAHQISRAENWLRKSPDRVFLDPKGLNPIPLSLPSADKLQVRRVCIALGASERTKAETDRRDLRVSAITEGGADRFTVGSAIHDDGFVHVFDENTLPVVLSELSTVPDFIDYLKKKEELFNSGRFAFADSELDLLAYSLE